MQERTEQELSGAGSEGVLAARHAARGLEHSSPPGRDDGAGLFDQLKASPGLSSVTSPVAVAVGPVGGNSRCHSVESRESQGSSGQKLPGALSWRQIRAMEREGGPAAVQMEVMRGAASITNHQPVECSGAGADPSPRKKQESDAAAAAGGTQDATAGMSPEDEVEARWLAKMDASLNRSLGSGTGAAAAFPNEVVPKKGDEALVQQISARARARATAMVSRARQ